MEFAVGVKPRDGMENAVRILSLNGDIIFVDFAALRGFRPCQFDGGERLVNGQFQGGVRCERRGGCVGLTEVAAVWRGLRVEWQRNDPRLLAFLAGHD